MVGDSFLHLSDAIDGELRASPVLQRRMAEMQWTAAGPRRKVNYGQRHEWRFLKGFGDTR
jgi:hypothetical protein